jgi:hypothetical protein
MNKGSKNARHSWLMPVILAIQEAEISRIKVQKPAQANSLQDLISKKPSQRRAGGVIRGIGPEFKPQ